MACWDPCSSIIYFIVYCIEYSINDRINQSINLVTCVDENELVKWRIWVSAAHWLWGGGGQRADQQLLSNTELTDRDNIICHVSYSTTTMTSAPSGSSILLKLDSGQQLANKKLYQISSSVTLKRDCSFLKTFCWYYTLHAIWLILKIC